MNKSKIENFKAKLNVVAESLSFLRDLSQIQKMNHQEGDPKNKLALVEILLDQRIENMKKMMESLECETGASSFSGSRTSQVVLH